MIRKLMLLVALALCGCAAPMVNEPGRDGGIGGTGVQNTSAPTE